MTTAVEATSELQKTLSPVRETLIGDARLEADRLITDTARSAAQIVDTATTDTRAKVEAAQCRGEASSQARSEQALARTRRDAYGAILAAKHNMYLELQRAVQAAVFELPKDPRFPALLVALENLARDQLGPETQIEHKPDAIAGLVATDGKRRVDYTLVALGDRALQSLADDVAELLA